MFPTPALSGSGYDGRSINAPSQPVNKLPAFFSVYVRVIIFHEALCVILRNVKECDISC